MKRNWKPLYFWIAIALCIPLAYFLIDRIEFVWSSKTVMGSVEDVRARNDLCGGKTKYSCTKYKALLTYGVEGVTYRIDVEAGRKRGQDQPLDFADHRVGDAVRVAYDPREPERAYRDTWWDIWGMPFMVFLMQIGAFFGSFKERRNEVEWR